MIYGVHIDEDDIEGELLRAHNMNIKLIQLFVDLSMKHADAKRYNKLMRDYGISCVVHASYSINLGAKWDTYSWWIHKFIGEIFMAERLGAFGIVVHLGKQMTLEHGDAINNMYNGLIHVHNKTKHTNVSIYVETSAGQGTEMCYNLDDYCKLFAKLTHISRFKMCIDTAHIFVAGYDIRTPESVRDIFTMLHNKVSANHIGLIHLNDAKEPLGSKKDRHQSLGQGTIGLDGLTTIIQFAKSANIPIVLETPYDNQSNDVTILANALRA